jgi:superfamily II DNA or RNA helicase
MIELSLNKDYGQINCESNILGLIRENFSMANPAYRKNSPYIQARLYAITPGGKFDVGLLTDIIKFLEANRYQYSISEELKRESFCGFKTPQIKELDLKFRDYQEKSIIAALMNGRGITVIPTAGGKTLICAGLIESLRFNIKDPDALVLVTVPSIQLVEQTANDFISYGLKNVCKWSGSNKLDPDAKIIVAGTQLLMSDKTDLSILADVKILLMDECHSLRRGNEINKVLKFIKTPHKFGFTGTMPTPTIDQWNIIGKLGPITYEQKTLDLKKQDYISNFKVVILNIKHEVLPKLQSDSSTPALAYQQELEFLMNHDRRNSIISNLANKLSQNTLIMVDRIVHGEVLEAKLKTICSPDRPVYFIRGSTDIEDRENIRKFMNDRSDVIIIAISKIFSTGINIPNLHNIIFASAGKAKIKIMQSIGRALRLHPTKSMAAIFDIADNTKYGRIHLLERKKLYNLEKYEYTEKELS